MNLSESADHLGVSPRTLRLAAERVEIRGRHPLPEGPWVFNRNDLESETAQRVKRRAQNRHRNGVAVPDPKQRNFEF